MDRTPDTPVATLPMALLSVPEASGSTQPPAHAGLLDFSSFLGRLARPRPVPPLQARLRDALVESRRNDRVCPRQTAWLRSCVGEGSCQRVKVAASRTLAALTPAPAPASLLERRKLLGQQLAWAARHGLIDQAYDYLHALQENQWLHFDDEESLSRA